MMTSIDRISTDFQTLEQSFSTILQQLKDQQSQLSSMKQILEQRLEEIKLKETQLNSVQESIDKRSKELEIKENQLGNLGLDEKRACIRFTVTMDGKRLQIFLNEHNEELNLMHDEVYKALTMADDPAKLVLDAMEGFYPPHLMKGRVEFESNIVRKSCALLLEQLVRLGPKISSDVKEEAKKIAFEWKGKMGVTGENSLEVLCFLLLVAAFELGSFFDSAEIKILFNIIMKHRLATQLGLFLEIPHNHYDTEKEVKAIRMVEGTSVLDHVSKIMVFIDELESRGYAMDSFAKVDMILSSLPQSFDEFVWSIEMNKKVVALADLVVTLKSFEDSMKKEEEKIEEGKALESKPGNKKRKSNVWKQQRKRGKTEPKKVNAYVCYHCGKQGHCWRKCKQYIASLEKDNKTGN